MTLGLTDDKSTLVKVMAWCRQATSHYLSQCWPRSMSPYGVTRPQWVNLRFSLNSPYIWAQCSKWLSHVPAGVSGCSCAAGDDVTWPGEDWLAQDWHSETEQLRHDEENIHSRCNLNQIEAWTKWPSFCRWHFEVLYAVQWKKNWFWLKFHWCLFVRVQPHWFNW